MGDGISLLDALRDELGCRSVKDGCSPQGQCGCCTVWVDGAPRVACVTPIRRVAGRDVTTLEGLSDEQTARWSEAFVAHGASQCGFCTPGIVMRLAALEDGGAGGRGRTGHGRARVAPRRRGGAPRPPVSLHRVAVDHRSGGCGAGSGGGPGFGGHRRRTAASPRPIAGRLARPTRGPDVPVLWARGRPWWRRLRR